MTTVCTWNVNSLRQRTAHVERFTKAHPVDVLCFQELKHVDDQFPRELLADLGYPYQAVFGQKTYNGVAMCSRQPLTDVVLGFRDGEPDGQSRIVQATTFGLRIYGLYCPNGTEVGSDRFTFKLDWYRRLRAELDAHYKPDDPIVVCGDMNVAPDDASVWDPFSCEGKLLFTVEERAALRHLMDFGLIDSFREKNPFSTAFTWWDYRGSSVRANLGLRIDHHLVTRPVFARTQKVVIHKEVRTWDQPSDHVPVVLHVN